MIDFPATLEVARGFVEAEGLGGRVALQGGDATAVTWPDGQDVVLMSYLVSALSEVEIDDVLTKAHRSLRRGGLLVVHDFVLDDGRPGPVATALWFLQYLAWRPDAVSFTAAELGDRLRRAGFAPTTATVLIPETTKVISARKVDQT